MASIAVCIPTFEPSATWLEEAVASAAGQLDLDAGDALHIGDDSTSAAGRRVVAEVAARYRGATLAANPSNLGMAANWNATVRGVAPTEMVMLLHQDDRLHPGALEHVRATFDRRPDVVGVGMHRRFIDEAGDVIHPRRHVNDRTRLFARGSGYVLPGDEAIYLSLRNGNPIGEPSAFAFRRTAFEAVGGFDTSLAHAADVDLTIRLATLGDIAFVAEPLAHRRLHVRSLTSANQQTGAVARERLLLGERYAQLLDERDRALVAASNDVYRVFALRDRPLAATGRALFVVRRAAQRGPRARALRAVLRELVTGRNLDAPRLQRFREALPAVPGD